MKKRLKISFIGGGHMGEALISALIHKKVYSSSQIGIYDADLACLKKLKKRFKITTFTSNTDLVSSSETILLAVKPQHMKGVLDEIGPFLTKNHLVLSIAAGLDTKYFYKTLPRKTRFIRIMPNLCAMIGEGAAAFYPAPTTSSNDRNLAMKIFSAVGKVAAVKDEKWLDAVTALSGSGPAFVFLFIDALLEAGVKQGLDPSLTKMLVLQTLSGAVKMVAQSQSDIATLIEGVASKGGTTEAGLKILEKEDFRKLIDSTIAAATLRAMELRQIF